MCIAEVVELVDTPSWGGGGESRAGSSPAFGTIFYFNINLGELCLVIICLS